MGLRGGHEADVGLEKVEKEVSTVNSELESNLISNKEHLSEEGLHKIISIKAAHNNGLSDSLNLAFPNILPISRPVIPEPIIPDPA